MVSLKKKSAETRLYNWRPNFRDYEALPDIRVVRAKFFVPALFITLAVVFLSYIIFSEYKAMNLQDSIDLIQTEIDTDEARHAETVKLNGEFMKLVRSVDEMVAFEAEQLIGSDFLLAISSKLLEGMYLSRIEYERDLVVIIGNLNVPAEEASRIVDEYLQSLKDEDILEGKLTVYKLTSLERDSNSGTIKFRIEISPAEKEEKKKK